MSKKPSFQFYPGDWMKDPALSMCSPSTRGIWMDLLCAMHEINRLGQIAGNSTQLSRVCRCSESELSAALDELKSRNTADVTECNGNVTVISRRLKREHFERENTKNRVQNFRCKLSVTQMKRKSNAYSSTSSSSSISNSDKEKKDISRDTQKKERVMKKSDDFSDRPLPTPIPDYIFFTDFWNQHLTPKVATLTESRKSKLQSRLKADPDFKTHFEIAIGKIHESDFLSGQNKQGWKASFDWLIENDRNYVRVIEGQYDKAQPKRWAEEWADFLEAHADD